MKIMTKHLLAPATIIDRPNRFIMNVMIDGKIQKCHCPTTGRIGQVIFDNIPCLVSKSTNKTRKTAYTVEAISLDKCKSYIGINQNAANRYVEHYLRNNKLPKLASNGESLKRECKLGNSKLDFLVDNTYIEVKTPLIVLNTKIDKSIATKESITKFDSFERLIKHLEDLGNSLKNNQRAIMLVCFLYDSSPFVPPKKDAKSKLVSNAVKRAMDNGVEMWQINFKINEKEVKLIKYFKLDFKY